MKKVRKVLVALAFSDYVKGTFTFAVDFAMCANAELIVANVINERDVESVRTISAMGYDVDGEHYIQNIKAERARLLEDIIADSDMPPESLYIGDRSYAGYETECGQVVRVLPAIRLSCGWVWAADTPSAVTAAASNFHRGYLYTDRMAHYRAYRALVVRSIK